MLLLTNIFSFSRFPSRSIIVRSSGHLWNFDFRRVSSEYRIIKTFLLDSIFPIARILSSSFLATWYITFYDLSSSSFLRTMEKTILSCWSEFQLRRRLIHQRDLIRCKEQFQGHRLRAQQNVRIIITSHPCFVISDLRPARHDDHVEDVTRVCNLFVRSDTHLPHSLQVLSPTRLLQFLAVRTSPKFPFLYRILQSPVPAVQLCHVFCLCVTKKKSLSLLVTEKGSWKIIIQVMSMTLLHVLDTDSFFNRLSLKIVGAEDRKTLHGTICDTSI